MHRKEKSDLQRLDRFNRWVVVSYWRWLLVKQKYLRQSLPLRIVPFHAVGMIVILLFLPHDAPPIVIIPAIVAAAYYLTILLLFIHPAAYKSKIKR
jgi:hypothetical protein